MKKLLALFLLLPLLFSCSSDDKEGDLVLVDSSPILQ